MENLVQDKAKFLFYMVIDLIVLFLETFVIGSYFQNPVLYTEIPEFLLFVKIVTIIIYSIVIIEVLLNLYMEYKNKNVTKDCITFTLIMIALNVIGFTLSIRCV